MIDGDNMWKPVPNLSLDCFRSDRCIWVMQQTHARNVVSCGDLGQLGKCLIWSPLVAGLTTHEMNHLDSNTSKQPPPRCALHFLGVPNFEMVLSLKMNIVYIWLIIISEPLATRDPLFPFLPDARRVMAQLVRSIQIVLRLDPWGVFVEDYLGSQTCRSL